MMAKTRREFKREAVSLLGSCGRPQMQIAAGQGGDRPINRSKGRQ